MTPRMSIIGAAIRKLLAGGIGGIGDYYWDKVVLAMSMNNTSDADWSKTSVALHMNEQDPYWSSTVLAMHMDDDPYWSNVVLAMHMDGADSGTVFTDVKGKTCTAKGNAQTKTATKKFGTASGYFDGTGDAILVSNSSDFVFGTGDFTIEFWVYPTNNTVGVAQDCLYYGNDGNNTDCWFVRYYGGGGSNPGGMSVGLYEGVTTESFPSPGNFVYPNRWNHIVVVRKGGQKYQIINGKKAVATTSTKNHGTPVGTTPALAIGREYHDTYGAAYFTGYIDDVRITKGVGRYDSSFYPPQRAFAEGVPIDEKGKTISLVGNASLSTTQKKFGVSSLYFDGTGDYATIPHSTDFRFGSADFTVEVWIYAASLPAEVDVLTKWNAGSTPATNQWILYIVSGAPSFMVSTDGKFTAATIYGPSLLTNTWNHIAAVRSGNFITVYTNGIAGTSVAYSGTLYALETEVLGISYRRNNSSTIYPLTGYIDELRITKGVARYTSNFVPRPAAFLDPITAPTFMDEKGNPFLEFGTPTLTATNAKFGGMSASFNGTTDYLRAVAVADFAFAAGDFTVEAWVRTGASGTVVDLRNYSSELGLFAINSGKASIWNRGAHLLGTTDLTTSTWFHLAWVRKTGVVSLYVNGKVEAISPTDGDFGPDVRPCTIGADFAGANFFNGLIDDVRITKGVARYTGEFTPTNYSFLEPTNKPMFVEETGKSVAAYGNVVTTTPLKYGDAAASFDGTGDYLTIPTSTDFDFGSGDFTVEFWIYFGAAPSVSYGIMSKRATTANYSPFLFQINASRVFDFAVSITGTSWVIVQSSPLTLSAWTHLACVRKGGTIELFVNGTSAATNSTLSTSALMTNTDKVVIGAGDSTLQYCLNGSIDDLRITKGLARYLSNFTPPSKIEPYQKTHDTDPYFNNVVLGMHMDGANTGTSFPELTGKTVSVFGNTQTKTATKKFGTASAYFDGTGDYLSLASTTDMAFSTGDFTIEAWLYLSTLGADRTILDTRAVSSDGGLVFYVASTNIPGIFGNNTTLVTGSTALAASTWYHLAVVKLSGVISLYLNGVSIGSASSAYSITCPGSVVIGRKLGSTINDWNGYIDDLRITKGVARYTANFQPVQAPFPDFVSPLDVQVSDPYWDYTVLAMHMDGTDSGTTFTDVKGNTVTANGNAKTVTATKKFGTASAYFDGTGDYLTFASSSSFGFGTSDFTIELWIYISGGQGTDRHLTDFRSANSNDVGTFFIDGPTNKLAFWYGTKIGATGSTLTTLKWYHVVLCRSSGTTRCFVNGILDWSSSASINFGATRLLSVGASVATGIVGNEPFNGYIDDLRITKGVARYTANFQPPGAFPEKYPESDGYWSSTVLAMHMDGADNGTTFTDLKGKTVTPVGNAVTKTATKMFGTASAYFDGTGDYLTVPASADLNFGTGDITIEAWIYALALPTSDAPIYNASDNISNHTYDLTFGIRSNGHLYSWSSSYTASGGTVGVNVWTHVAFVRNSGVVRVYINGISVASGTISTQLGETAANVQLGGSPANGQYFNGYIDDLQVIKGAARYKANFAVPTRAFNNG